MPTIHVIQYLTGAAETHVGIPPVPFISTVALGFFKLDRSRIPSARDLASESPSVIQRGISKTLIPAAIPTSNHRFIA